MTSIQALIGGGFVNPIIVGAIVFGPGLRRIEMAQAKAPATPWELLSSHEQLAELDRRKRAESATSIVVDDDAIDTLRRNSTPVPGRDGVRRDHDGRVWYSARWLGLKS